MYNCKNKISPSIFHSLYSTKIPSNYSLRSNQLLTLNKPINKYKISDFGIHFRGPSLWNNIILNKLKNNLSFYSFKRKLKLIITKLDILDYF